jgi:hypothetical protein
MPCEQCEEEGKYRWGENGECMYETLEDCQLDNQGEYLEEQIKPAYDKPVDFTMHFTKEQMEKLHGEGEVLIEVEGNEEGETMNILFTYDKEEREEETEEIEEIEEIEEEREYGELTVAMLDDELDEYIDKLTDSIKKL